MTERLTGYQLPPGIDKKGDQYARKVQYGPGMKQLVEIVAVLQKDVKRINQCLTESGAKEYAKLKGKNWSAHEADIIGNDGIPEVFVTDGEGNVKVINGWVLKKSDYPIRKAYYKSVPKANRKDTPFTTFKDRINEIKKDLDDNGNPSYVLNPDQFGGPKFANIRKEITPKEYFKQMLFKPYFNEKKETYKAENIPPMKQAQLFNKGLTACFIKCICNDVLPETINMEPSEIAKKMKDYKVPAFDRIAELMGQDPQHLNQGEEYYPVTFDQVMGDVENAVLQPTQEDNDY